MATSPMRQAAPILANLLTAERIVIMNGCGESLGTLIATQDQDRHISGATVRPTLPRFLSHSRGATGAPPKESRVSLPPMRLPIQLVCADAEVSREPTYFGMAATEDVDAEDAQTLIILGRAACNPSMFPCSSARLTLAASRVDDNTIFCFRPSTTGQPHLVTLSRLTALAAAYSTCVLHEQPLALPRAVQDGNSVPLMSAGPASTVPFQATLLPRPGRQLYK